MVQCNAGCEVVQAYGPTSEDLALNGSSPGTKALSPQISDDLQVVWIHTVIGEAESLVVQDSVDATSLAELDGKRVAEIGRASCRERVWMWGMAGGGAKEC